ILESSATSRTRGPAPSSPALPTPSPDRIGAQPQFRATGLAGCVATAPQSELDAVWLRIGASNGSEVPGRRVPRADRAALRNADSSAHTKLDRTGERVVKVWTRR